MPTRSARSDAARDGVVKPGKAANRDPKVTLIRKAATAATERYGIGGRLKKKPPAKPSLPRLKCLE